MARLAAPPRHLLVPTLRPGWRAALCRKHLASARSVPAARDLIGVVAESLAAAGGHLMSVQQGRAVVLHRHVVQSPRLAVVEHDLLVLRVKDWIVVAGLMTHPITDVLGDLDGVVIVGVDSGGREQRDFGAVQSVEEVDISRIGWGRAGAAAAGGDHCQPHKTAHERRSYTAGEIGRSLPSIQLLPTSNR